MLHDPITYNVKCSNGGKRQDYRSRSYAPCVGPANVGELHPVDGVYDKCDSTTSKTYRRGKLHIVNAICFGFHYP